MKINVEFTSLSDMATFTKFINDSLVPPTQKQKTIASLSTDLLNVAKERDVSVEENRRLKALLERAYERIKLADPKGETANYDIKKPKKQQDITLDILNKKIGVLNLTARAHNCLLADNVTTIAELVAKSENDLLKVPNLGRKSLKEIKQSLKDKFNLTLR